VVGKFYIQNYNQSINVHSYRSTAHDYRMAYLEPSALESLHDQSGGYLKK